MIGEFSRCTTEGCELNAHRSANGRSGLCSLHYQRIKKHGDPSVRLQAPSPAKDWIASHKDHIGQDCLIWPFYLGRDGYGRVHYPGGGLTTASRMMCIAAHGDPPFPKAEAAHTCGRGSAGCVNPNHIRWASCLENQTDRVEHGTSNRGEQQWAARLTEDDIRAIRRLALTESQGLISERFGIHQSHVSKIVSRSSWAWLD